MTGIDGYDWASVGWSNPVPGDPDVVRQIADQFASLAAEASSQNSLLRSVGSDADAVWKGGAADAFHPTVAKLPGQLDKLVTSYRDAADALNGFWPRHRSAQQTAVQALAKAKVAQAAQGAAKAQLASAQSGADGAANAYNQAVNPPAVPGRPQSPASPANTANLLLQYRSAQHSLANAQSAVSSADADMQSAIDLRDRATSEFNAAAAGFVNAINAASHAGIQNPHEGLFGSIFGGVEHLAGDIGHDFTDAYHWSQQHVLPVLKVVDTVLSDASLVVGVVALVLAPIPGVDILDAPLEALNETLMVAKTATDAGELALGDTSALESLAGDALGLATLGIGSDVEAAGRLGQDLVEDGSNAVEETGAAATSRATSAGDGAGADVSGPSGPGDGGTGAADPGAGGGGSGEPPTGGGGGGGTPTGGDGGPGEGEPAGAGASGGGSPSGGGSSSSSPTTSSRVSGGATPVKQGEAGVDRTIAEIQAAGGTIKGREITLDVNGVRTRPDLFANFPDPANAAGKDVFVEVKTGPNADLTANQTTGYPGVRAGGAVPRGGNAARAGLTPGSPLPPTPVVVVRQPWPLPTTPPVPRPLP